MATLKRYWQIITGLFVAGMLAGALQAQIVHLSDSQAKLEDVPAQIARIDERTLQMQRTLNRIVGDPTE